MIPSFYKDMIKKLRLKNGLVFSVLNIFLLILISQMVAGQTDKSKNEQAVTLNVMTHNLKFASPTFKPIWKITRDMQIDLIRKYTPDIIGTQEGLKEQIDYLADHLSEYVVIG